MELITTWSARTMTGHTTASHREPCVRCGERRMVSHRRQPSGVVRIIGGLLWVEALASLALAATGTWLISAPAIQPAIVQAQSVEELRMLRSLPPHAIDDFVLTGALSHDTFAQLSRDDRWTVQDLLAAHEARMARASLLRAVVDFADRRMWWTSIAVLGIAFLMTRRRRALVCMRCGTTERLRIRAVAQGAQWRLLEQESAQDIIEYALLAASIAIISIPTVAALGTAISTVFAAVAAQLARG